MAKKIDISSTAIEKGIDIAKQFLDKLIMPAIEESGLLLKEQVVYWKFKNQVRMLNKAKEYCEKNKIAPKQISFKLLCPLLDFSGIEEDDYLQDKWAILLSNMVDSDQNIENHVFPYILSQLSSNEFLVLEKVFEERQLRVGRIKNELDEFKIAKSQIEENLLREIEETEKKITKVREESKSKYNEEINKLQDNRRNAIYKKDSLKHEESAFLYSIRKPEIVPIDSLKEFELSNLIRLGLVKEQKEFYTNSQTFEIPIDGEDYLTVDIDLDMESNTDNILTELGVLFIIACKEKNK